MTPGSVIVDIAIDQGGCVEGIHATTSEQLSYIKNGVIHSAVPNMPAAVARTASQSLSSAILPYVEVLASEEDNSDLQAALFEARAIYRGDVVDNVLKGTLKDVSVG